MGNSDEEFNNKCKNFHDPANNNFKGKSSNNNNYQDLLESKIRNQAKRLFALQEYKQLCEKRILQLCPHHPLPVVDSHIKTDEDMPKNYAAEITTNNFNQTSKLQFTDLTRQLNNKDNVFNF
jgi:hypothetical protein